MSSADTPVPVGKITKEWGLCGELFLIPNPPFDSGFRIPGEYFLLPSDSAMPGEERKIPVRIKSARRHGNRFLIGIEGCDTPEKARLFRSFTVMTNMEPAGELSEWTFPVDLIVGMPVYRTNGAFLGTIREIIRTGCNDVYVVAGDDGEILLPAIRDVIRSVEPGANRMIAEPMEMI